MHSNDHVVTIRCRADNYAYLVRDEMADTTTLIDVPETAPIRAELDRRGWRLTDILLTHHHDDHIAGVADLRANVRVIGAAQDAHRLPVLDKTVSPGDEFTIGSDRVLVIDAPGHTVGHIAFYLRSRRALFSGDSLMVHGCGRLFEGTPAQMQATIAAMAVLPPETQVWSGHDYAAANLRFAALFAPDAAALAQRQQQLVDCAAKGHPTTGVTLAQEMLLNPYLRVDLPMVKSAAGLPDGSAEAVFAAIRAQKDSF